MTTEFEATFLNIDKNIMRNLLKEKSAVLIRPEFMQRRVVFNLPKGHEIDGGWVRVRDEGDKVTMSLKIINGTKIDDQKEIYLEVSDFKEAEQFLTSLGCQQKAFQESKRELWKLKDVDVTIDEWLFLEPFIEIEGQSEIDVKETVTILGFDYNNALFCSADELYHLKYGVSKDVINNHTPYILFAGKNPFLV